MAISFNLLACCPLHLQLERWPLWFVGEKKIEGGEDKKESQDQLNQCKGSLPHEFQSPISFFVPLISMWYLKSSLHLTVV